MRYIAFFLALILIIPFVSYGQTSGELTQRELTISSILSQIATLQVRLTELSGTSTGVFFTSGVPVTASSTIRSRLSEFVHGNGLEALLRQYRPGDTTNERLTQKIRDAFPGGGSTTSFNPIITDKLSQGIEIACPMLTQNLQFGSQHEEVTQLQQFLKQQSVFDGDVTGFFGAITQAALQKWQAAQNIVSTGEAVSTGWGVVGPKTRAHIAALCGNSTTSAPSPVATGGACVFAGTSYQHGTLVIPCNVQDPLSACFSGTGNNGLFTHPLCKNGSWVAKETGVNISTNALAELEKISGTFKTIYDPSGILSY